MKAYRIIAAFSADVICQKLHRGDKLAKNWMSKLMEKGVFTCLPVRLQRRVMTDTEVAKLPLYSNGDRQSAWVDVRPD